MTKLPPQASRAGKNRYYHRCDAVDTTRHYGICLFTIEAFERGQELNETPCVEAMKSGNCPAMVMRQQEQDAGEALYFKASDPEKAVDPKAAQHEKDSVDRKSSSYQRGFSGNVWGSESSQQKAKPKAPVAKAAPKKRIADELIEFDVGALVNDLANEGRTVEAVKREMLEVGRPAARRRKEAVAAGKAPKSSVFDYMSVDEKKDLARLKRELVNLKMGAAA
jgi:hypothetical protein